MDARRKRRRTADRGSILPIALVSVVVFGAIAAGIAGYAASALKATAVTKSRVADLGAAEGAMRLALEDIRLPRTVADGQTTSGSATVTSTSAAFRSVDVGKGIAGTGIPVGATILSVVNPTTVTISGPATATATGVLLSYGNAICGPSTATILSTTVNGTPTTVKCIRQPSIPGEFSTPAVVITTADGLELGGDSVILGDVFFAVPPASLAKKLLIEEGDVWYPATSCPSTPPTVARLTFDEPDERTFLCVPTAAADKWSDLFALPAVADAGLAAAPPSVKIITPVAGGFCQVFFPGAYTTEPDLVGTKNAYFKSGVYYFNNVGRITVSDTAVTGGQRGDSPAADGGESLFNPSCDEAAKNPAINDVGTGVTLVLAGNTRFDVADKGRMELFAPNNGYSIVAFANPVLGYAASTGGSSGTPLIDQSTSHSLLRVHGGVWAPDGYVTLGPPAEALYTVSGYAAVGGQLFGGIVVKHLEIADAPPTDGYNVQSDTYPGQYRVLVVATAAGVTVRAVADVRPSGEELALRSWSVSTDNVIATPSTPTLVTKPALVTSSDTGTKDDNMTSRPNPTFFGSAAPGATVKLYDGATLIGSGIATGGSYSITTSTLAEGNHPILAAATDAGGDTTESTVVSITVDRTAPTVAATGLAIAPVGNSSIGGFIRQGGQYYVYAKATDAFGLSTLTADVSALTTGKTAEPLVAGMYTLGAASYEYRSAPLTANAVLAAGAKAYTVTAGDYAGNLGTSPAASVSIENTAPTGSITAPTGSSVLAVSAVVSSNSADTGSGVSSAEFQYSPGGAGVWTSIAIVPAAPYTVTWDTSALTAATYDLRVITTDSASNTFTSPIVNVSMRPPNAPSTPVLDPAADSGVLGDNKTSIDKPTFTGTAGPGTTVTLLDGGAPKITAIAAADGTWSVLLTTALSQNLHTITATATSVGGLVSDPSGGLVVLIDKTDPVFAGNVIAAAGNTTSPGWVKQGGQYFVYANATDAASGMAGVTADVRNVTTGLTAVPMVAGSWTIGGVPYGWRTDVLTADAVHTAGNETFKVTATDLAANSKSTANTAVVVDNTAPTGSITAPSNGWATATTTVTSSSADNLSVGSVDFQWSASGLAAWASIGVDVAAPYSVAWDTTGLTQGGTYDLRAVTSDSAGNTFTSPIVTVVVDRIAPTVPSTPVLAAASDSGVIGDGITKFTTPTLTGTAEAGTTVKLYDGATLVGTGVATGGNYAIATSALAKGAHTITATSADAAGNTTASAGAIAVIVDPAAPAVASVTLANGGGTAKKVDAGDTVTIVYTEVDDYIVASTLCSAWTDSTVAQSMAIVTVTVEDKGNKDELRFDSASCTFPLGLLVTGGNYVQTGNTLFLNSTVTWDPATKTLRFTLGTLGTSFIVSTNIGTARPALTPPGTQTDRAGNPVPATLFTSASSSGF